MKPLELGSERTPAEFVANLVRVFGLVRVALAEHGTVWLNIGDTYTHARGKRKPGDKHGPKQMTDPGSVSIHSAFAPGIEEGNLCLIPQRLAIALQDDGWIVRSVIVWSKPAPMPSSVAGWAWRRCRVKQSVAPGDRVKQSVAPGDRVKAGQLGQRNAGSFKDERSDNGRTSSAVDRPEWSDCPGCPKCSPHGGYVLRKGSWRPTSSWEPILMLSKSDRYFCDGEAVKTTAAAATVSRDKYTRILDDPDEQFAVRHDHETICSGANPRDVQVWASEPLKEKHYAAFPSSLVRFCLRAGTSANGYCPACGMPWVRVVNSELIVHQQSNDHEKYPVGGNGQVGVAAANRHRDGHQPGRNEVETIGWRPSCQCPPHEPRPALVLDCFCGSGRTGLEANRLGLDFVGCELNPEYVAMARRLLRDESPLFHQEAIR